MTQTLSKQRPAQTIEQALVQGDLAGLSPEQRVSYYQQVCGSLGLNPLTKPFDYIVLNGKLTLYARKDCTDQLRKIHKINILATESKQIGELFVVTCSVQSSDGRRDTATGAVPTGNLRGEALANALMKAETKAKRRATLSICGLGMTDESEVDSIPNAFFPEPEDAYVPTREQDIDDEDLVRSADDRWWQRYLELVDDARALGLNPAVVRLPVARSDLGAVGEQIRDAIHARQEQLDKEEAARIVGQAKEAAKR